MTTVKALYAGVGFSKLFTTAQPKLNKSTKYGYLSAGLSFAPASTSGRNVCPHSTPGCRALCLTYTGQGGIGLDEDNMNPCQSARINRTRLFYSDPERFWEMFEREMTIHIGRAYEEGLIPEFRPNVYSDILWERVQMTGYLHDNMFQAWPMVEFHDYTKVPYEYRPIEALPRNYHLTMSLAESNDTECMVALEKGRNVAAVFRGGLPESFGGYPVINGDEHDLRFLDQGPCIVGLTVKGHKAKRSDSPFIRNASDPGFQLTPQRKAA